MKKLMKSVCSFGAIAVAIVASPAFAQDAPQAEAEMTDGDIVVTATRRETTLQNTALAVTAISGDELTQRGVSSPSDLTKLIPAIKIGTAAGSAFQVTIRGVGNSGGNGFADAGIGFNLDGVYLARTAGPSGILYDLNRVEVLKGPQGTLYGRNSTGGVVNVITNDPGNTPAMNFTGEYGNAGHIRAEAAVTVPLSDSLSLRVAGLALYSDGFTPSRAGAQDTKAIRAKLKFAPTDDFSILLQADYSKTQDGPLLGGLVDVGATPPPGVASLAGYNPYKDIGCGPTSLQNLGNAAVVYGAILPIVCDSYINNSQRGVSATINYDFGPVEATVIVANRQNKTDYLHYGAGFPVSDNNLAKPSEYTTAELRLASDTSGPLSWQVGGFYITDSNRSNIQFNQGATYQSAILQFDTKSLSGFGEATYAIVPSVRVTLGGRYTSDKKDVVGSAVNPVGGLAPIPTAVPTPGGIINPLAGVIFGTCTTSGGVYTPGNNSGFNDPNQQFVFPNGTCRQTITGKRTFNKFTWKAGIEADVGPRSLAYANVSTGFRSGGFISAIDGTQLTPPGRGNSYEPETITAYTAGIKNRFMDNKLTLNIEAFYYKYKNKQISHLGPVAPAGFNLVVDNAGAATLYGAEVDLVFRPSRNDTFNINVQYEKATYDSLAYLGQYAATAGPLTPPNTNCGFSNIRPVPNSPFNFADIDCSGFPVTYAPKWIVNAGYTRTFELGDDSEINFGIHTQIQSAFWLADQYLPAERQKTSMVSDATLSWTNKTDNLTIGGYIKNIENERVGGTSFLTPGGSAVYIGPPRTYGARLSIRF